MSDTLGRIPVPDITPSGTFPIKPDFGSGMAVEPEVVAFQFGAGGNKVEQRFVKGNGYRKFTVKHAILTRTEIGQLADFWELNKGAWGAFTYNAPDGQAYTCRFADQTLTFDYILDDLAGTGVVLQELPAAAAPLTLSSTVERFPTPTLANALLDQAQVIIPLIRIKVREAEVAEILISDRRVTVGGKNYQARLMSWDGIQQGIEGEADEASFSFGNGDRCFSKLANDTDLWLANIEFSLFHVGTGTKIDLWKGDIQEWSFNSGPEFKVTAHDGIYELGLPYPTRRISRTCWKIHKGANCPYSGGNTCDKSWDACKANGMTDYFGGIIASPQGVRTKDNGTGVWGYGRNSMQSTSVIADSVYSEVLPEIWYDNAGRPMAVNAKLVSGRDEGDFFVALGIVGRGPLGSYSPWVYQADNAAYRNTPVPAWHTLDGQPPHGPTYYMNDHGASYGLRQSLGHDPVQDDDPDHQSNWFSLGEGGDGVQTYAEHKAAGVAFVEIRRKDEKGLQLSRLSEHSMTCYVSEGLSGLVWTGPGQRTLKKAVNNPVWVAVNCVLMSRGLWGTDPSLITAQEALFDVGEAIAAAAVCDLPVSPMVTRNNKVWVQDEPTVDPETGAQVSAMTGHWADEQITSEKQFVFNGSMQEQKPLRDWLREILLNCLGYSTFSFGKLRIGSRFNSSAASSFSAGNIVYNSLELSALKPEFNRFSATFANEEYDFASDNVSLYDANHAERIGGATTPVFLDGNVSLAGTHTRSQAARIITARLREELGGVGVAEQRSARRLAFKTTILSLDVHPGMVCSLNHDDMPSGSGEFRVLRWKLNSDYSIDIEGRTTTDSMYSLIAGPKPPDVVPDPVTVTDVYAPADFGYRIHPVDGKITIRDLYCATNPATVHQGTWDLYYVPEDRVSICSLVGGVDSSSDTITLHGGDPLLAGQLILVDGEVMQVSSVTGETAKVKRGILETTVAEHPRVTSQVSSHDGDAVITAAGDFKPGNLMVVTPSNDWGIIGSYSGGKITAVLPFPDLEGQTSVYSDPRIYPVLKKTVVITFAPRFFTSGARADFSHTIDLQDAGLVAVVAVLENTRGQRSDSNTQLYCEAFPHRWRNGGHSSVHMDHPVPPQGVTLDLFEPIRMPEAQAFNQARAEWKDDVYLPAPAAIPNVSLGDVQPGGTITLHCPDPSKYGFIQVTIGDPATDSNFIAVPQMGTNGYTEPFFAQYLCIHLNNNEEFRSFFRAANTPGSGVVQIYDNTGRGGKLIVTCSGGVTAEAAGMTAPLGIKTGRKYAATFSDGANESNPSSFSPSTGPTGGAAKVELKDLPVSDREDITTVRIYATPNGQDGPLHLIGSVPNGTESSTDSLAESELGATAQYGGPVQPEQDGECLITVKKDGHPWFLLSLVNGFSNIIHAHALGSVSEGAVITADVDNSLPDGELTVFID